ncbi:hypothetical protein FRX31_022029, partial [Thalictrum thalictroides]
DLVSEFKSLCPSIFESRRFHKVNVVRERGNYESDAHPLYPLLFFNRDVYYVSCDHYLEVLKA